MFVAFVHIICAFGTNQVRTGLTEIFGLNFSVFFAIIYLLINFCIVCICQLVVTEISPHLMHLYALVTHKFLALLAVLRCCNLLAVFTVAFFALLAH